MKPIVQDCEIQAPLPVVFEVFTDLGRARERVRAIEALEVLTPGPFGEGTRFRETRKMFGHSATETMEVRDFRPGQGYALTAESHGCRYLSTFEFTPSGAGTRVRLTFTAEPLTTAAKMMGSMMSLMAGSVQKAFREDLEDLKQACEAHARA